MKRFWKPLCILAAIALLGAILFLHLQPAPITQLTISPASIDMVPGVSVQLHVHGTTADGRDASTEQLAELTLVWSFRSETDAFTVSKDGILTAECTGIGNVQVSTIDGDLHSRPITVFVK